jgi:hypothetical protein
MAYGIVHRFPAETKEQYEASLAKVHATEGIDLPVFLEVGIEQDEL